MVMAGKEMRKAMNMIPLFIIEGVNGQVDRRRLEAMLERVGGFWREERVYSGMKRWRAAQRRKTMSRTM